MFGDQRDPLILTKGRLWRMAICKFNACLLPACKFGVKGECADVLVIDQYCLFMQKPRESSLPKTFSIQLEEDKKGKKEKKRAKKEKRKRSKHSPKLDPEEAEQTGFLSLILHSE